MVYVPKCVERKRCRVVSVADGHSFGSGGACRENRRFSRIGKGHGLCCREGCVDSGGEGEAKVSKSATDKVCVDRRRV